MEDLQSENEILKKRIKLLQQTVRRKNKKIETMKGLLQELKDRNYLNHDVHAWLEENFSGLKLDILKNEIANCNKNPHAFRYSDALKQFALTLHFYSPKAYNFTRKVLNLPNPSSLRQWRSSVDCQPGFLKEVLLHLQKETEKDVTMADCALLVDAMSIRKQTEWNHIKKQFEGFVNYGGVVAEPNDDLATECLVFMAVGIKQSWKHVIGYFFVNKLSAQNQAQLIKSSIELLADHGMNVHAVTFDGCYTNQSTANILGAKLTFPGWQAYFPHPNLPDKVVYIILDACDMLKLMRNTLADMKILKYLGENGEMKSVEWRFIEELVKLQEKDTLFLANKLTAKHAVAETQDERQLGSTNSKLFCCRCN
ncbi:putative DNA transposase THAP9-like [Apostichopus japonicus]|uniref:Putative DNA transposase THAP9-like n=1 Tax=Stichopus japonicus TaxID=307972 RepID=A0A2G8KER5_STIJA|nr:putative DNA transposase THAP9-like [Apostichopus japonicus]